MTPEEEMAYMEMLLLNNGISPYNSMLGIVPGGDEGNASTDEKRSQSFANSNLDLLMDNALMASIGMGGLGVSTLQPTTEREEIELPGQQVRNRYLGLDPDSMEGLIARRTDAGFSPTQIANEIIDRIAPREGETPEEAEARRQFSMGMPRIMAQDPTTGMFGPSRDPDTNEFLVDTNKILEQVQEYQELIGSDPVVDETEVLPDGSVRGYKVTETESPIREWFRERGLPQPDEQYSYYDFLPTDTAERMLNREQDYYTGLNDANEQYSQTMANDRQQRAMLEKLIARRDSEINRQVDQMMGRPAASPSESAAPASRSRARELLGLDPDSEPLAYDDTRIQDSRTRAREILLGEEPGVQPKGGRGGPNSFITGLVEQQIRPGIREKATGAIRARHPMQQKIRQMSDSVGNREAKIRSYHQDRQQAYRDYLNQYRQVVDSPHGRAASRNLRDVRARGGTPLSDVLAARQAMIYGMGVPRR